MTYLVLITDPREDVFTITTDVRVAEFAADRLSSLRRVPRLPGIRPLNTEWPEGQWVVITEAP